MLAEHTAPDDAPRHVVVLAHPSTGSFNHAVAARYCATVKACGQHAVLRDLYALDFDPRLRENRRPGRQDGMSADVANELGHLRTADVVVLVYPIWFGMPPAILKGYIDRVLGAGVTVQQVEQGTGMTLMTERRLVSITSSGASKSWLKKQDQIESLRNVFERYLVHALNMKSHVALHFGETVEGLSQDFIDPLLGQVQDLATTICEAVASDRLVVP